MKLAKDKVSFSNKDIGPKDIFEIASKSLREAQL